MLTGDATDPGSTPGRSTIFMKILVICYSYGRGKWKTVLDTWFKNISPPHRFVFSGDIDLYNRLPGKQIETWVTASGLNNHYDKLPLKTLNTLRVALQLKDWDILYKCDDDTLFNITGLESWLGENNIDVNQELYAGYPAGKVRNRHYAAGGTGYILTRKTLIKNWDTLEQYLTEFKLNMDNRTSPVAAEDVGIGHALLSCGVEFNTSCTGYMNDTAHLPGCLDHRVVNPDAATTSQINHGNRWISEYGGSSKTISLHHLTDSAMRQLYNKHFCVDIKQ